MRNVFSFFLILILFIFFIQIQKSYAILLTNENEIDLEARDAAVEKVKQYYQEQYAKPYDENYIPTVDEELEEIRKKQEVEEAKRVVRLNTPHPVNVGGFVPRSMSQEERDLWDLMIMGPQLYAPGEKPKSREELYKEQVEEFRKDYDAGVAESLMQGGSPEMLAYGRAARLAFEKWEAENTKCGSSKQELDSKQAYEDIMSHPELYLYVKKTGDMEADFINSLYYDEILQRAINNKIKDIDLNSGNNQQDKNFSRTKFIEEYNKICRYPNKVDFDKEVKNLVDKYFTLQNKQYWVSMADIILMGYSRN